MAKTKRTYQKPLTVDMEFNEALGRFAQTDPKEVQQEIAKDAGEQRVRLVQYEDGGHPLLIYVSDKGINVELPMQEGTLWANQSQMADMFGVSQPTISEHISNVFKEGELSHSEATHRKFRLVRMEGQRNASLAKNQAL